MSFTTTNEDVLLKLLKQQYPESSMATIKSWIIQRRIFIGKYPVTKPHMLVPKGATIRLAQKPLPKEGPVTIVYEDKDIIVIDKPSGLLSVANEKNTLPSAHAWIKHRFPGKVIPVLHRLDQDTSGLLIFPLHSVSFRKLKEALAKKEICRTYRAILEGQVPGKKGDQGKWVNYIKEDASLKMHVFSKTVFGSQKAVTHYTILEVNEQYTVIDCTLETGKKNQIRAQAAYAGFPIAGDKKYGCHLFDAKRLCLHARRLSFIHPTSGKEMVFESHPPLFFDKIARMRARS